MEYVVSPVQGFDRWSPVRVVGGLFIAIGLLAAGFMASGAAGRLVSGSRFQSLISLVAFLPFLLGMFGALFGLHAVSVARKNRRAAKYLVSADKVVILIGEKKEQYNNLGARELGRGILSNELTVLLDGSRVRLPARVDLVSDEPAVGIEVYGLAVHEGRIVLKRWESRARGPLVEQIMPFGVSKF